MLAFIVRPGAAEILLPVMMRVCDTEHTEGRTRVALRKPSADDIPALSALWHDGWHEAHDALVPKALSKLRTTESFAARLETLLEQTRISGPPGEPDGLCIVRGDEINQLFVASDARGTGVAAALIADGENRLRETGIDAAWLACAVGNLRAARFYQKAGWSLAQTETHDSLVNGRTFPIRVWRYEKQLTG